MLVHAVLDRRNVLLLPSIVGLLQKPAALFQRNLIPGIVDGVGGLGLEQCLGQIRLASFQVAGGVECLGIDFAPAVSTDDLPCPIKEIGGHF